MERSRKHKDIKLVTNFGLVSVRTKLPKYKVFSENLLATEMKRA